METNEGYLKKVIGDVFGLSVDEIDDATSVDTVETWDSLKHMQLVLALEAEFDIALTEEQIVQMLSYPLIKVVLCG